VADAEAMVQNWVAAIESLDLDKTMSCYADDIVSEDPAYGYRFAGLSEVGSMYVDVYALPDLRFDVTSSFVSGDGKWAAAEWTWSGTKGGKRYSILGV
jgi:ketosteroid isomerase-like protein